MAGWQLGALLTELRTNRLHDVSAQVAGASDYLWSDQTLVNYINEACRRFARRSLCIRDGSSSICNLTLIDGTSGGTVANPAPTEYALDPSIIAVLSLRMGQDPVTGNWDNTDLARAGHTAFSTYSQPNNYFFNPSTLSNLPPGKPLAWGSDERVTADTNGSFSVINLAIYPVTNATYAGMTGTMRVIREPINDLVLTNLTAYPEIPAAHHLDMLDWAAYLALSNVDTDIAGANAADRAKDAAARFEQHCMDARKEALRKLFAPTQWGFGRNGWSWES